MRKFIQVAPDCILKIDEICSIHAVISDKKILIKLKNNEQWWVVDPDGTRFKDIQNVLLKEQHNEDFAKGFDNLIKKG